MELGCSSTYGYDHDDVFTLSSSNPTLFAATGFSPTDFYDGFFKSTQWTSNIDINRDFDLGLAGPLNFAVGGEYRRDSYAIGAGVPASYSNGGAQSYPGFNPQDAGIHSRKNEAAYIRHPESRSRSGLAPETSRNDEVTGTLTTHQRVAQQRGARAPVKDRR